MYLSLNQGATGVKDIHKSNAKDVIEQQANNYRSALSAKDKRLHIGPIDLDATPSNNLSPYYEKGAIYSYSYELGSIPSDEVLIKDLNYLIGLYNDLYVNESTFTQSMTVDNDDDGYIDEDLRKFRIHKSVERPSGIAKK